MTPESVDKMLRNYKLFLGRCKYLEAQIAEVESVLDEVRRSERSDAVGHIAQQDGMPHGTAVGHPTERIALMFAEGKEPRYIEDLAAELETLRAEWREKCVTVRFVESWLNGLNERERWIIQEQVIDGNIWKDVLNDYCAKFSETRTKNSLQKLKQRTLGKIYLMAV